jgi:nucleoside-diphosphate-sugar epimerase
MGWEHVLPQLTLRVRALCRASRNDPISLPIQGTGCETRAFVFIDDFMDGLMTVMDRGLHLGIYHIGTEEETPIAVAVQLIGAYFGRQIEIIPGPAPKGQTLRRCPDIGKLRDLGYRPRVTLAEGLPRLVSWYDANADLAPKESTI